MAGSLSRRADAEAPEELHEINVTPFIDVILVLLIVFMVAAPLATVDVPVELPGAAAERAPRPVDPVYVTLALDGGLALGETTVPRDALPPALTALTGGDRDARIYLRADRAAPYGELMAVLDLLRGAGYLRVALVALESP